MTRLRTTALVTAVALFAAIVAAGAYLTTHAVREPAAPTPTPTPPAPRVLAQAGAAPSTARAAVAPVPLPAAVTRALAPYVRAAALGRVVRARVLDATSGAVLYDRGGTTPAAPASTAKLLTAAAILTVHRPDDRITTVVRRRADGALVLVGAGDPTLSAAPAKRPTPYADAARISDLAAQVRRAHVTATRVVVDDSLFRGPAISPGWAPEDVPSDYASAITPLMADGGRDAPGDPIRSTAPDLAAGHALAAALGRPGLSVTRGTGSGAVVASVRSAPIVTLVSQMLMESDNVIAECLARLVAVAEGRTASFTGSAQAVRATLTRLGTDPGGGMVDGSGLAAADRVAPAVLAALLRDIAVRPALRDVVTALPVAAWSGTLAERYVGSRAAGDVRAKTGTLAGVSTLAGFVHDRDGRLLIFAVAAVRTGPTPAAETALDALVTRLQQCGCR